MPLGRGAEDWYKFIWEGWRKVNGRAWWPHVDDRMGGGRGQEEVYYNEFAAVGGGLPSNGRIPQLREGMKGGRRLNDL